MLGKHEVAGAIPAWGFVCFLSTPYLFALPIFLLTLYRQNNRMFPLPNYEPPRYRINSQKACIVGKSLNMLVLFKYINYLTDLPTTVLIRGETGAGKELVAQAIHYNNKEGNKSRFVAVTCSGIPQELLESILFGHTKGAFTGAYINKKGQFEYAEGGTIFLDEIGDMSPYLQAKILRVLQEKEITPVGGNESKKVNVRVISATNKNLEEKIRQGEFRADLFHRINVFPVYIPPLREKKEDIGPLCGYFIEEFNKIYGKQIEGITNEVIQKLQEYDWPGNVRELKNVMERVFVHKKSGKIHSSDILFEVNSEIPTKVFGRELVGDYIKATLEAKGFNQSWLAETLGVSREAVSQYVTGECLPEGELRQKLIAALGLDTSLLNKLLKNGE